MENLCRVIIWSASFLEHSGDDIIDPDSAVKALEDMAFQIQRASDEEKTAFIETCQTEAARLEQEQTPGFSGTADYIRGLPESMGIE